MKHKLITSILWFTLLIVVIELNTFLYNLIFFPIHDPVTDTYNFGSKLDDIIMLSITAITFGLAGFAIAWRMRKKYSSMVAAMSIGVMGLSIEIGLRFPWFQLMPSHPSIYDHLLAFFGSLTPPLSGAIGAMIYRRFNSQRDSSNAS